MNIHTPLPASTPRKRTLLQFLLDALRLPESRHVDLDAPDSITLHRRILQNKLFLKQFYTDCYQVICREADALISLPGQILEIGSGGGFLKDLLPTVITSDVCPEASIDRVIVAGRLPFGDQSLKLIFLLNVLHHLSDAEAFFRETDRCLVPGGRAVFIEPYNSWMGRWMYRYFHHEPIDAEAEGWTLPNIGRMATANIALPWIIFWRDRTLFETRFPHLKIRSITSHTFFTYLLSGGLTWKTVVPAATYPLFRAIDRFLSRWKNIFPIFQTIILEKRSPQGADA